MLCCVVFPSVQFGRKPLFMMSLLVMCVSMLASASIIFGFGLEDADPAEGISVAQTVAGYSVSLFVTLFQASAVVSVGYVGQMYLWYQ